MILITHDMGVIAEAADRVAVLYSGRIAEIGPVRDVIKHPQHPYTKALLAAVPKLGEMTGKEYPERMVLMGRDQGAIEPIKGSDEVLLEV